METIIFISPLEVVENGTLCRSGYSTGPAYIFF